ncbi:MAG: urease subunit beta [Clostridium sp.]
MIPGEVIIKNDFIEINTYAGDEEKKVISVINKGDRAVQVGSHFHFFEINRCMKFSREEAYGYRLNIPSGTAIRFEPDEVKEVELVKISGNQRIEGFNNLTDSQVNITNKGKAILNAKLKGFE